MIGYGISKAFASVCAICVMDVLYMRVACYIVCV